MPEINIMDVLKKAFTLSNEWKFFVKINSDEIKEMTYLEFGTFIVSNKEQVKSIHIKLKIKIKDCNECNLYSECDHQGAYMKDGKWCYD